MGEGSNKIRWTENAIDDQDIIVECLLRNWSITVTAYFLNILEGKLNTLLTQPLMGIVPEKNPLIRSVSITKHNRLY